MRKETVQRALLILDNEFKRIEKANETKREALRERYNLLWDTINTLFISDERKSDTRIERNANGQHIAIYKSGAIIKAQIIYKQSNE